MLTIEVLTTEESALLQAQEQRIAQSFKQFFVETGQALNLIRDSRLYRATHSSFEDYCRERWNIGKTHALQLIQAAETVALLRSVDAPLPENERQARELTKLKSPELQIEAWLEAVKVASGDLSSAHVRAAVEQVRQQTERPSQAVTVGSRAIVVHGEHQGKQVQIRQVDKGVAHSVLPDGSDYPFLTGELEIIEAALPPSPPVAPKLKTKDFRAILEEVYQEVGGVLSAALRTKVEGYLGL